MARGSKNLGKAPSSGGHTVNKVGGGHLGLTKSKFAAGHATQLSASQAAATAKAGPTPSRSVISYHPSTNVKK